MRPTKFKGQNSVFAESQPEYLALPVFKDTDGEVISCWQLSVLERLKLLFTGKLWLSILTFNKPLQPQLPSVDKPDIGTNP